jgi:hypothetical protein
MVSNLALLLWLLVLLAPSLTMVNKKEKEKKAYNHVCK